MNNNKKIFIQHKLYIAFSNPLFYIICILFNTFCAFQFFFIQNFFAGTGTTDFHYFFNVIPYISIIIIPVLCIKSAGTDYEVLLPFSNSFRFFASCITNFFQFIAMLLPIFFVPICVNLFGDVDFGQFFISFLLIVFYAGAAISCTNFFFYVTFSNTIAFIVSAFILSLTNSIHIITKYIATSSDLMNIVKLISFSWHFDRAAKGIADSRDIFYFIAIAILFFTLAIYFLERKSAKKYSKQQKIRNILIIIIFVFSCLNASRYFFRFDFTKDKKYSISSYTKKIIDTAQGYINITYYRSDILSSIYPQTRDISDILVEFATNKNVSFLSVNADKPEISTILNNYGIISRQIQSVGNNKTEYVNVYSSIVIEYNGQWEIIPFILSPDSLEYDLCSRITHLITQKTRYINILCGNDLSLQDDYNYVVPWLNLHGFVSNVLNLEDKNLDWQLEQSKKYGDLLLIIGSSQLSDEDCMAIENYLEYGKKVLFAVSPYQADIENSWNITKSKNQKLISMLSNFGTIFSQNIINDISCARITMESNSNADGTVSNSVYSQQINYFPWISLMPQANAKQGITLFWPVSMDYTEQSVSPVLRTSTASYEIEPDFNSQLSLFETNPFVLSQVGFNPNKKEQKTRICAVHFNGQIYGFYNTGIYENVEYEVIPDQYFVNTLMLGYIGGNYGDYRNLDFLVNRLLKLNGEQELAELQEKFTTSTKHYLYKITDEKSFIAAKNKTVFCLFIINPIIIIIIGISSFILRKKNIHKYSEGL